ncbi:MAG: hypothetical protein PUC06_02135 [Oscillospiraceae bacterium]|nr:hypothetical protein [Oscillospiraceae bacterium]
MSKRGDRYFDGYQRVPERDAQGNVRYKLRYMDEWYGYEQADRQKKLKLAACPLTLMMLVCYFIAQLNPSLGGMMRYMAIPSLLALVPMMFVVIGLVNFLMAKQKWEKRVYYAGYRRLFRAGIVLLILLAVWLVLEIVFICMNPELLGEEVGYLLFAAASTGAETALVILLQKNPPRVVDGPTIR